MGVRVTTDFTGFDRKFSEVNLKRGRLAAANDALQAMNTYFVPMLHTDSGTSLRAMSYVNDDGTQITWNAAYASYQFRGAKSIPIADKHFSSKEAKLRALRYYFWAKANGELPKKGYTTPGTSSRWDLRLKGRADLMDKVSDAFFGGANWNG